jgi:hypothetical protein
MPVIERPLQDLSLLINGAVMMGFCVTGLFFLRFWRKTRDRLFLLFAASFFVLGFNRLGLALSEPDHEKRDIFYLIRFLAFVLILFAILDKNRATRGSLH